MLMIKSQMAVAPRYADEGSAGLDLYAELGNVYILKPKEIALIKTGISVEIPEYCFGAIYARSSLHTRGLALVNGVGIIDSSYRGEILLPLMNISNHIIQINGKDGIITALCQLILQPYLREPIELVSTLSQTKRQNGGFGSTDNK